MTPEELRRRQTERYATDFELVVIDRRERVCPDRLVQAHIGGEIREVVAAASAGDCLEARAETDIRRVRDEKEHTPWKATRY